MTDRPADDPILSRPLNLADVPPDGRSVLITATPAERAALAAAFDLPAVDRLEAQIRVVPWGRHGFRMTGRVGADVVQSCVVTLEPVAGHVDEPIDIKLIPAAEAERLAAKAAAATEIVVDAEAEDPPDVFDGVMLDPGAIAEEHFVLGLDPYPRKPGVAFEPPTASPDDAADPATPVSPFAALTKLRRE